MLPVGSSTCAWAAAGLRKHMFLDFTLGVGAAKLRRVQRLTTGNDGSLIAVIEEKPTTGNDGSRIADIEEKPTTGNDGR